MSLTSHLNSQGSPIGDFLRNRFAQTANITKESNPQLRNAACLQPQVTPGEYYPYGTIGHAIDYRMRYAFALTSVMRTVACHGAAMLVNLAQEGGLGNSNPIVYDDRLRIFAPFFTFVDTEVARMRPVQRALAEDDEQRLGQICFVLGLLEETFRSGQPSEALYLFVRKWIGGSKPRDLTDGEQHQFIEDILALVKPIWVDDICQMINLFLVRGRGLFNRPFVLNPTFAGSGHVGGADADLIVDGCLIDIKSSKKSQLDPMDLRQLIGYVLLDYSDEHSIRSVAIYKARYGLTFTWPIEEFLNRLAGHMTPPLADLRAEFQAVCQQCHRAMRST